MGPRIFAALGDRGGPTICRLNTAGETRPLVSSSSPLLLFSSLGLFPRENRARFRGDIIWISWRTRLKKSRFFEKSRTDRIPTEFELCQTNRRSIGLEHLSARGPNVKCPWPNVEPLCLAVVKEFGVWLLLVRCKLSGRVPPRINPVLFDFSAGFRFNVICEKRDRSNHWNILQKKEDSIDFFKRGRIKKINCDNILYYRNLRYGILIAELDIPFPAFDVIFLRGYFPF